MSDPKTLRDRANAAEFVDRPGEAEALRKAADRIAELEAEVERLRRWRVEQDCCYTMGAVADMSGSHCPSGRPCVRCEHEREVERLSARIPDPDDIKWAAARASDESLYCHVNEPNGEGEAFYARRAARLRATLEGAPRRVFHETWAGGELLHTYIEEVEDECPGRTPAASVGLG